MDAGDVPPSTAHRGQRGNDLFERTELTIEGDGVIEVGHGDQCRPNGPRWCDVVSGHSVASLSSRQVFSSGRLSSSTS